MTVTAVNYDKACGVVSSHLLKFVWVRDRVLKATRYDTVDAEPCNAVPVGGTSLLQHRYAIHRTLRFAPVRPSSCRNSSPTSSRRA
eukprot:8809825-Pyramimonas_sp.AAC.1